MIIPSDKDMKELQDLFDKKSGGDSTITTDYLIRAVCEKMNVDYNLIVSGSVTTKE